MATAAGFNDKENTAFMHSINEDETQQYSRRPIITSTNVRRNNDKGVQHPRDLVNVIKTCIPTRLESNCRIPTVFGTKSMTDTGSII
jgi:uncharacterized protein YaaQ